MEGEVKLTLRKGHLKNLEIYKDVVEARYFVPFNGRNHMFCWSEEVFRVRLPASDAPIKLASPFTSYKDIVKNAVVWTYFDWLKAERPSGSNP
jgi:hypothetical protein